MLESSVPPFQRIVTIALTDLRFRFRTTTALVTLLIVAALVYLVIPDYHSGSTLMQVNKARVYYNSATVAVGTAIILSPLLTLFGFYLISNTFRRDILTRTAYLIAATPVSNTEYLLGKYIGNVLYLTAVTLTCMVSAMVMFLIRGETALEPLVFLSTYGWLLLPSILFCSAVALTFESVRFLSGRLGDVLYFFVWGAMLSIPAIYLSQQGGGKIVSSVPLWLAPFDIIGFGSVLGQMSEQFRTNSMSIGFAPYDQTLPPILFRGLTWNFQAFTAWITTLLLPVVLLSIGIISFHRYNPTRIKGTIRSSRRNIFSWVNNLLKPVTKVLQLFVVSKSATPTLLGTIRADVLATLTISPVSVVTIAVFGFLSVALPVEAIRSGLLPVIIVALIITLADITTRDTSSGMMPLLFTAPWVKQHYVLWKFFSALVLTLCFTLIPMIRLATSSPSAFLSLLVGSCLMTAGAIGFGILAKTSKVYIAVFLMLLYIALNAPDEAIFDFAGFTGSATPIGLAGYILITGLILITAQIRYRILVGKL